MFRLFARGSAAVLVMAALGVAGCGLVDRPGKGKPAALPSMASPSPTPVTEAGLRVQVRRATVELTGFHAETKGAPKDEAGVWKLMSTCKDLPSDRKRTVGYQRLWDGKTIWIRNYVAGYLDVEGRQLVAEARKLTAGCKTYKADGRQVTVLGPIEVVSPEGIDDTFAYCELVKGGGSVHQCLAVLARGHLAAQIDASDDTRADSEKMLRKLIPIAAQALIDAA